MKLLNYLSHLLAGKPASSTGHGERPSVQGRVSDIDSVTERLNRMLWEKRAILSGNIHLVGLGKIRDRVGEEWERIAERAQDIAQKSIQRACSADDVFTRYDELSYLIIFSSLNAEQAQLRCVEIAEDIGRRLLGENFISEAAEIKTGVFETDGSLVFNAITKQDLVTRLVGQTHKSDGVSELLQESGEAPDFAMLKLDKTRALASLKIMYQPMWNLRHQAITSYFAIASARNVFGNQLWDEAIRHEFSSIISPAELDTFVTRTVMRDIAQHVAQGNRVLVGWPVHFETLATRVSRDAYMELCRELPEAVRQLLVFELCGLPAGIPNSRIIDVTGVLCPFCRNIMVRISADHKRFDVLHTGNIDAVGFSLSGFHVSDAQRIAMMNQFVEGASRAGLRTYIHGLADRTQALAAVAAGFEWISGPAVEQPLEALGRMRRFSVQDLYRSSS